MKQSVDDWLCDGELERCAIERLKQNGNGAQRFCECRELIMGKRRAHTLPAASRLQLVAQRSALVPEALQLAIKKSGDRYSTKTFNEIIDELAAPLLKQSGKGKRERKAA
jgi:hypothetical protein